MSIQESEPFPDRLIMSIQESEPLPDSPKNTRSKQLMIPRTMQEIVEDKVMLILDLFEADLITNFFPFKMAPGYRVVFGLRPLRSPHDEEEFWTPLVLGHPDPIWRSTFKIELTNPWELDSLTVELMRYDFECSDPGTHTGTTLVGQALIRLPRKLNKKKSRVYPLEKLKGGSGYKTRGYIHLDLRLCPMMKYGDEYFFMH